MSRKSWSPYKEMIITFVGNNPGCCKYDVARYCTTDRRRDPSKQYYIVNTAIKNGWIKAEWKGNRYSLSVKSNHTNIQ
jgi:hypothetical protein